MTIDREALRRLADGATPGPWKYHKAGGTLYSPALNAHDRFDALSTDVARIEESDADAEFIAAARTALPELLDAIARVQALIDRADHDGHTHVTASALQWAINGTVTPPAE